MSLVNIDPKEIRRLWILKLVSNSGTIKQAARAANLTSSAVSQALSGLESALDRRLLVRQGERFVLTSYGQGLLKAAEPALLALSELHRYMKPAPQEIPKFTSLTLGTTQSIAIEVLPGLAERLREKCPGIRIHMKIGRSANLCAAVKKGDISIALIAENDQMADLRAIPISEERMGFYCSSRPEIAREGWDLVEKLGVGAFPPDTDGYAPYFRKLFKTFGPRWKPALLSESYEALRALAASGSMVSVLSTRVAATERGDLVEISPLGAEPAKPPGTYRISLVTDRSLDSFQIDFLANELQSIMRR